ncbi:AAA family ATPase [uncultured Mailhella sp.]|uniref:AAA family ATPase n=1 Tax=uncultured Mailhella sp. TaxID=1981031 RepID=UPI00260DF047|nr:AAA family ATPase [uncultured Mailhella sp.]
MSLTQFDAGTLFSGNASGTMINGYDTPSEYTPALDPFYVFHGSSRDVIVWLLMQHPEPLYLCGPTSAGKSSLVRQIAARLNYPVFEATGHDRLEFPDLVGHLSVQNGTMVFQDGPLTMAMKQGGIFLFNEADLCSPATLAGLNTILDGSPLCIAENGGELVVPDPMFRFIVTANTNGNSDDTGLYQGVVRQNLAFMDRFMVVEMGYPTPEVERDLLDRMFPQLTSEVTAKMVEFANDVRRNFMGNSTSSTAHDALEVTFSTRALLRWARLAIAFQPLAQKGISPILYALDRALGFRATATSRTALHEMAQRTFPAAVNMAEPKTNH